MNDSNEAGRRLYAAIVSHRMGLSIDWALKNYVPEVVNEDWIKLALMIDECIADDMGDKLNGKSEPSPTLIDRLKAKLAVVQ